MHLKVMSTVLLSGLVAASVAQAQQTFGQADQTGQDPSQQPAGASWSASDAQPRQAGDLYQVRQVRSRSDSSNIAPQDGTLPGALNPGPEPLESGRQTDSQE